MRIGIDVMGGDHAPDAILAGSLDAVKLLSPEDQLVLIGDESIIREGIAERGLKNEKRLQVEATTQVIGMADPPVTGLREKPDSSIVRMGWLGGPRSGEKHCEIIISAGNTGACVASAQMSMRRLPGVKRPGIAVTIPTFFGPIVVCDVGANPEPKAVHLHQYGHMATAFAQRIVHIKTPRVGLLSIGGEEGKGTPLVKETGKLMKADSKLNFVGNVEGRDLFDGKADVIVTEGFTGNVVLKLAEGLSMGLFKTIAHEMFAVDPEMAMKFEPVVKSIYKKHDHHEYGGAPLLGARGIFFKCHGSSEARTIVAAVRNSLAFARSGVNEAIVEALAGQGSSAEDGASALGGTPPHRDKSSSPGQAAAGQAVGVRLAGTGVSIPTKVLTNDDLAKMVDTSDEWIVQRTGIRQRHIAANDQSIVGLAKEAVGQALDNAGLAPQQLNLLILATLTPEMVCPSSAARVVAELGAIPAGAVDISAACSGFVYGLNMAASMIRSGFHRTVAVVGAELLSRIVDWEDRSTCILFGDGAGAAVLTASDDPGQGCLYQSMSSNGSMWPALFVPRSSEDVPANTDFSGKYNTLQMVGREVYKFAVPTLQKTVDDALAATNIKPSDLAMVISHQSNIRMFESLRERLGLPPEKLYVNIDRYGNTSAASVPICLHELRTAGKLKTGDLVLFIAMGGGMTWASSVWRL